MNRVVHVGLLLATVAFGKATELDVETISGFIKDNENALVKFYAPWCGHCKAMAPAYDEAANRLSGKVALGKIDVTEEQNKPVGAEYDVSGFPTLKFFHNAKSIEYTGGRDADGIVSWVTSMTGPAVVEAKNREDMISAHAGSLVVSYCGALDESVKEYKTFVQAAEENRGQLVFVAYECESKPSMEMIRKDGSSATISDVSTPDKIVDFVNKEKLGYFDAIGPENAEAYMTSGLDVVYFGGSPADYEVYKSMTEDVAKKIRSTHLITHLDIEAWPRQAEGMLKTDKFPCFVIPVAKEKGNGTFLLEGVKFTETILHDWIKKIQAGTIKPTLQSESIPETNDEPVKVVVSLNFDEMVNDETDVMLEIMASWCGACKSFADTYEEIARKIGERSPKTIIAKIDGAANDIPAPGYEFTGFPTIYFKPAGGKPIRYDGERTEEDVLKFIEDNGTEKFAEEKDEL